MGSEMCIRDRSSTVQTSGTPVGASHGAPSGGMAEAEKLVDQHEKLVAWSAQQENLFVTKPGHGNVNNWLQVKPKGIPAPLPANPPKQAVTVKPPPPAISARGSPGSWGGATAAGAAGPMAPLPLLQIPVKEQGVLVKQPPGVPKLAVAPRAPSRPCLLYTSPSPRDS